MKSIQLRVVVVVSLILLMAIGCQVLPGATPGATTEPVWTGFIEGDTLDISSQAGGTITDLAVAEGASVQAGQVLYTLQDDLVRGRIDIADANVRVAKAQVDLLEQGARPEDIRQAEARVAQAEAGLAAARQVYSDTLAIRANPQTLVLLQAQANLRLDTARAQYDAAVSQAQAADFSNHFWEDQARLAWDGADITLPGGTIKHFDTPANRLTFIQNEWNKASNDAWQAWNNVAVAKANLDAAEAALGDVQAQIQNPIALDAQAEQARAARDRASAALDAARAGLQILREGASLAQVQAAHAALDQATARRAELDQELARYRVAAPRAGVVLRTFYRRGEVVGPTLPVVQLSIEGKLTLRVFVSVGELTRVKVGQEVSVTINDLDAPNYSATVTRIADQAEFTARQAQTDAERNAHLVAVEASIKDPDARIKSGMTASISFGAQTLKVAAILKDASNAASPLMLSGNLEARKTRLAPELGGRAKTVSVSRGAVVKTGDKLIELDDTDLQANLGEARATVNAAQSSLDQVKELARPGTRALAQAHVTQAQADLDAANRALDVAKRARVALQDLTAQIHVWEGRVAAAQADVNRGTAALAALENQLALLANDQSFAGKSRLEILQKQREGAEASLRSAQANLNGSNRVLALYRDTAANPLESIASLHAAENQVKIAEAGLASAQAELAIVSREAQPAAVALAQGKLDAAKEAQKLVEAQIKRMTLVSPADGTIVGLEIDPGEIARAASPLVTVADTREFEMTLYVPIRQLNAVRVGQNVAVKLPSLPGKTFKGQVTYLSPSGEFKPANIYNSQERSEVMFALTVVVPNTDPELKAGLPADAVFE